MDEATQQADWYTLAEASKLLGVHPATVRLWGDEGKLSIFRTPGGHRRFARDDVQRLMQLSPAHRASPQSYIYDETIERTRKSLPEVMATAAWAQRLPEEERAHWRTSGRLLVSFVGQLATRAELSPEQHASALECGRGYGLMMASRGYSLPDAVIAFLFFRDSLLETVLELPETTGLQRGQMLALLSRVNGLMTDVLRVMMESFTGAVSGNAQDLKVSGL